MDNPQVYQPLSAALHLSNPPPHPSMHYQRRTTIPEISHHREEEEEDDDDDDDEEDEHNHNDHNADNRHDSHTAMKLSPKPGQSSQDKRSTRGTTTQTPPSQSQENEESPRKRRPGRPRGSKNRKPRATPGQSTTKLETQPPTGQTSFFAYSSKSGAAPGPSNAPPQHPDVNSQNQQYYDFQWRVLNLCAEFYGAAEELVKGTPPLVVAQCYHTSPTSKVDPLSMLNEAKRVCDTLLANPSQLVMNPPPAITSVPTPKAQPAPAPRINHAPPNPTPSTHIITTTVAPSAATSSHTPAPTTTATHTTTSAPPASMTSKFSSTPTVITNPQSFVVPLGVPPPGGFQFPMYPPQYPTAPYYQYPYAPPGTAYYSTQHIPGPSQQHSQPVSTPNSASAPTSSPNNGGNQGAWSDEETERLRKVAEQSKGIGSSGEIEWDWVVHQWGPSRTRHQILIKATSMGLKETTGRGIKRRRENDSDVASPVAPPTPSTASSQPPPSVQHATSPSSHPAPTPIASPALQNQQRPPSSAPKPPSNLPWPMPVTAANTASPVITPSSSNANSTVGVSLGVNGTSGSGEPHRSNYYRHRPSQDGRNMPSKPPSTTPGTAHHGPSPSQYMYQTNGNAGRKDSAK